MRRSKLYELFASGVAVIGDVDRAVLGLENSNRYFIFKILLSKKCHEAADKPYATANETITRIMSHPI